MSTNCIKCGGGPRVDHTLMCAPCKAEAEKIEKAKYAIEHVLKRIRDDSTVGYMLGWGTESFSRLTKAAAVLWDEPLEKVEKAFMPRDPKDPFERRPE